MTRPDRLHVALGLLVALGVAWRAIDKDQEPGHQPALQEQIARVEEARGKSRNGRPTRADSSASKRGPAAAKRASKASARSLTPVSRGGSVDLQAEPGIRVESTPLSVVASGGLKYVRGAPESDKPGIVVDVEGAEARELDALPGVGPALARRIVEERTKGGPFVDMTGLQRVKGIGPKLAARLAPYVTFGPTGRPLTVIQRVHP